MLKGEGAFTLGRQHGRNKANLHHLGVTSRAACETCNNTWMSQFEQTARPLLTPPIQDRGVEWASEAEQTSVAVWAMKTALMLDRSVVPSSRTVPDKDFTFLSVAFAIWTNTAWTTAHPPSTGKTSQGYSISFTVGHALFIVTAFENEVLRREHEALRGLGAGEARCRKITNSAGHRGATPISMIGRPRPGSFWVVDDWDSAVAHAYVQLKYGRR